MKKTSGTYTTSVAELVSSTYCNADDNGCDLLALQAAASLVDVYNMSVRVIENATALSRMCTARPCYLATVELTVPCSGCQSPWRVRTSINENQYLRMHTVPGSGKAPCLPDVKKTAPADAATFSI